MAANNIQHGCKRKNIYIYTHVNMCMGVNMIATTNGNLHIDRDRNMSISVSVNMHKHVSKQLKETTYAYHSLFWFIYTHIYVHKSVCVNVYIHIMHGA